MSVNLTVQSTPITITVQDQAPITLSISSMPPITNIILSGTTPPPSPTGIADGTIYFQYQ